MFKILLISIITFILVIIFFLIFISFMNNDIIIKSNYEKFADGKKYNILEDIKSEIDLSALGQDCITYGVTPKTVKNVLLRYEQEICDLKDRVNTLETTAICDINITNCGIDLSGINNNCSSQVTTLGELLTYLVDNI